MKKRFAALITLLFLLFPCASLARQDMTLVHATDMHYISPRLTDNGESFAALTQAGDGKVNLYADELMEAFAEEMIAMQPDAVILSGDLTFNGERFSHEDLAAKLARIEAAGVRVLVLPGNHDLDNEAASGFAGNTRYAAQSLSADGFAALYRPFGYDDAVACDPHSLSYVSAPADHLRILMLDTNTAEYPCYVRPETLTWVRAQLEDARRCGAQVIAVSHQNLLIHNSMFYSGVVIGNHKELLRLYEEYGVKLNLSGHMHMQHIQFSDAGTAEIATSALSVAPNQYGVITLDGQTLTYAAKGTDVSAWARASHAADENLLAFDRYAEAFFKTICVNQARRDLVNSPEPQSLADYYAQLNYAYFSGRLDTAVMDESKLARWYEEGVFTQYYIRSIMAEPATDHTRLHLPFAPN